MSSAPMPRRPAQYVARPVLADADDRRVSGAISAVIGAFALSFGRPKPLVAVRPAQPLAQPLWLLAAWIVLQLMTAF